MSTTGDFKSDQYEFTDEQAKNVGALAHSMAAVAMMLKLLGLAFVIFAGLQLSVALSMQATLCSTVGLGGGCVVVSGRRILDLILSAIVSKDCRHPQRGYVAPHERATILVQYVFTDANDHHRRLGTRHRRRSNHRIQYDK